VTKQPRLPSLQSAPPDDAVHGIHPQLLDLAIAIDKLTPDPVNARSHDKRNMDAIVLSYSEHGQRKPIVVQERNGELVIRAGNGQTEAAKRLGWTHIAAVIVSEADADAVKFAIRDNRSAELAGWELPNLGDQLRFLRDAQVPLEEVGFEPFEYEPLMVADWTPPGVGGDDFNVPEKRVSLMFTRSEWDELKELLAAKPSAALVLAHLKKEVEE
jgi:hypothetical protein